MNSTTISLVLVSTLFDLVEHYDDFAGAGSFEGGVARLGKMTQEASGPRIGKCPKENVSYFSKDWEEAQIGENGQDDFDITSKEIVVRFN